MRNTIPIFNAERDAGLAHLVSTQTSITYNPQARLVDPTGLAIQALLVTVGWDTNDNIYEPLEIWTARSLTENRPVPLEGGILGQMAGFSVRDEQGRAVGGNTLADGLPKKFNVVAHATLHKTGVLQAQTNKLLAEIAQGGWCISTDCFFRGFDYALICSDGRTTTIARNEKTAFLTKHLQAYGGAGKFEGKRLGRVLRNITFSGKGLVRKPDSAIVGQNDTSDFGADIVRAFENFCRKRSGGVTHIQRSIANLFGVEAPAP